jgi:hypothetical protein
MCPSQNYTLGVTVPPGATVTSWSFIGDFSSTYYQGNLAYLTTSSSFSGSFITVNGTGGCGESFSYGYRVGVGSTCGYSLTASEVEVYPNPVVSEEVTVEWPKQAIVSSIALIDKYARTLQTIEPREGRQVKVDISKLPAGEYFLHLYAGKAVVRKRFLKK